MSEIELRDKISKEFNLDVAINEQRKAAFDLKIKKAIKLYKAKKEMDKFLAKLRKKNGTTEY